MNSREYEIFIGKFMGELAKIALVDPPAIDHLRKFIGKSGEEYEIDVSYSFRVAEADYLTLAECKYWNKRVGRDVVSAFKSVVEDIGAHKGIIVSTVGFQSGAVGLALKSGIALFKVSAEDDFHLHAVARFEGPSNDIVNYLTRETKAFSAGEFKEWVGITNPKTHFVDFIYDHYGERAATLLYEHVYRDPSDDKLPTLLEIEDGEWKRGVVEQIRQVPPDWVYTYCAVEFCGLNMDFPTLYGLKVRQAVLQVGLFQEQIFYEDAIAEVSALRNVTSNRKSEKESLRDWTFSMLRLSRFPFAVRVGRKEVGLAWSNGVPVFVMIRVIEWKGTKAYHREITRLLQVCSHGNWAGTVLLLFIRNQDFSPVVEKAAAAISEHEKFVRTIREENGSLTICRFQGEGGLAINLTVVPIRGST